MTRWLREHWRRSTVRDGSRCRGWLKMDEISGDVATNKRAGTFLSDETGQDLVEYSLLIAFVALAGAAAFIGMSGSVNSIWSAANSRLAAPNSGS